MPSQARIATGVWTGGATTGAANGGFDAKTTLIPTQVPLSNNGYTVGCTTNDFNNNCIKGYFGHVTGKWYFQATLNAATLANGMGIGVGNTAAHGPLYGWSNFGQDANSIRWATSGEVCLQGPIGTITTYVASFTVEIAVDLDIDRIWFRLIGGASPDWNAGLAGTQDPASGAGGFDISVITGTIYPMVAPEDVGQAFAVNFGTAAWTTNTPPSGFTGWELAPSALGNVWQGSSGPTPTAALTSSAITKQAASAGVSAGASVSANAALNQAAQAPVSVATSVTSSFAATRFGGAFSTAYSSAYDGSSGIQVPDRVCVVAVENPTVTPRGIIVVNQGMVVQAEAPVLTPHLGAYNSAFNLAYDRVHSLQAVADTSLVVSVQLPTLTIKWALSVSDAALLVPTERPTVAKLLSALDATVVTTASPGPSAALLLSPNDQANVVSVPSPVPVPHFVVSPLDAAMVLSVDVPIATSSGRPNLLPLDEALIVAAELPLGTSHPVVTPSDATLAGAYTLPSRSTQPPPLTPNDLSNVLSVDAPVPTTRLFITPVDGVVVLSVGSPVATFTDLHQTISVVDSTLVVSVEQPTPTTHLFVSVVDAVLGLTADSISRSSQAPPLAPSDAAVVLAVDTPIVTWHASASPNDVANVVVVEPPVATKPGQAVTSVSDVTLVVAVEAPLPTAHLVVTAIDASIVVEATAPSRSTQVPPLAPTDLAAVVAVDTPIATTTSGLAVLDQGLIITAIPPLAATNLVAPSDLSVIVTAVAPVASIPNYVVVPQDVSLSVIADAPVIVTNHGIIVPADAAIVLAVEAVAAFPRIVMQVVDAVVAVTADTVSRAASAPVLSVGDAVVVLAVTSSDPVPHVIVAVADAVVAVNAPSIIPTAVLAPADVALAVVVEAPALGLDQAYPADLGVAVAVETVPRAAYAPPLAPSDLGVVTQAEAPGAVGHPVLSPADAVVAIAAPSTDAFWAVVHAPVGDLAVSLVAEAPVAQFSVTTLQPTDLDMRLYNSDPQMMPGGGEKLIIKPAKRQQPPGAHARGRGEIRPS